MGSVAASLATMGMGQLLLASVFLGSYALALGQFAGTRGRFVAIVAAILTAAWFVALSEPWEVGVILISLAPVSLGLFAGAAWTLLAGVKHEPGNSGCAGLTGTRPTASCTGISADPGHHFRLTRTAFRAELNAGVAHPVAQYTRVQIRVLEQPPSLRSSVPRAIESALQNWFSTPYVADIRRDAAS